MKKTNKKGAISFYIMLLAVMLLTGYILFASIDSEDTKTEFVGASQQKLVEAQENSLQLKSFLDMSMNLAKTMTIKTMSESNGFLSVDTIREHEAVQVVYPLLNAQGQINLPDYEKTFEAQFRSNLDSLLNQYRGSSFLDSASFDVDVRKINENILTLEIVTREALSVPVFYDFSNYKDDRFDQVLRVGMPRYSYEGIPLYPIKDIPNVICEETPSSVGRICAANKEVIAQLRNISEEVLVKEDLHIVITQAYRTYAIQQRLLEEWCAKGKCKFACDPAGGNICPHMQAGAIDLNIFEGAISKGVNLNKLDEESKKRVENIMCDYGFVRWMQEDWHFEYGTKTWERIQKERETTDKRICTYG